MNSTTVRTLLVRGMLAGAVAGLLASVVAYVIGIPSVDAAIAYETAHSTEAGHDMFSRAQQSTIGLATAMAVFGTAIGGIGSLAFCFAFGRIGRFGARTTAVLVALGLFATTYLVPFLKYPANPPATSDPATLNQRTTLFFLMVALSVLLGIAALMLGRTLAPRWGTGNAAVTAVAAFVAVLAAAMVFLPTVDETPADFPANVLWQFRLGAIGTQIALWAAFALLYGRLAERVIEPRSAPGAGSAAGRTATAAH